MAVQTTSTTSTNLSTRQVKFTHPTFTVMQPIWQQLRDVREGTGGFLDGSYIIAHPREWLDHSVKDSETGIVTANPNPTQPSNKLRARRRLATSDARSSARAFSSGT